MQTKENICFSITLLFRLLIAIGVAIIVVIFTQSRINASQAPFSDKNIHWNNVKSFGAKGDGRDDTTAFHAAMCAGRRVYIPAGMYRVNLDFSVIPNPDGLILMGDGYGNGINGTVLKGYDATLPVIRGEFSRSSIVRKIKFQDLVISQSRDIHRSTKNDGIRFKFVYEVVYESIYFINLGGWAVNLENCIAHSFYNCQFFCGYPNISQGGLKATNHSNLLNIFGGRYTGSGIEDTNPAFLFEEINGVRILGCSIESWGKGVVLDDSKGKIVDISIDAHFEENNYTDVQLGTKSDDSRYTKIIGVNIRGTFAGPIDKTGYAIKILGKHIRSTTFHNAYITNRIAVINLDKNSILHGVQIGYIYHDGVKLLEGYNRNGLFLTEK